jgi:hypothetical protein
MRILTKIAIAAVVVLVLAALSPVEAICGSNPLIRTRTGPGTSASFIWGSSWAHSYYAGYPAFGSMPPLSANADATFWALGTGNPALGPGDDAGTWTAAANGWMYYINSYYGGWYAAEIFTGWGTSNAIDGCVQNNPAGSCTCVLITDQDGTTGYFALASDDADAAWNFDLVQPGTDGSGNFSGIILEPIPAPTVVNAARKAASLDLDITVNVPMPAAGIYQSGGSCACGPIGYKVKQAIVLRGQPAPSDRVNGWTDMALVGGGAQAVTAMGSPVTVESLCGASNQDVYIATELVFDSDFVAPVVSGDATRVECGPDVAEPERPRFRPGTQRPPRTPSRSR